MSKEIIEQVMEDGIFVKFKSVRDSTSPKTKGKKRYMGADWIIGIERKGNIMVVKNGESKCIEIANQKECDLLGVIYYYKPWKKFVWEQCPEIIMAKDCLRNVTELIKDFEGDETPLFPKA